MAITLRFFDRRMLWLGFGIAVLLVAAGAAWFVYDIHQEDEADQAQAWQAIAGLSSQIHDTLMPANRVVKNLAQSVESGRLADFDAMTEAIKATAVSHPRIYGCGVALDPSWLRNHPATLGSVRPNAMGQASLFVVRGPDGAPQSLTLLYDYTDTSLETTPWYTHAAAKRQSCWVGPYFGQAAQTHFIAYSRPLFDSRHQFMGVAFATVSLSDLRKDLSQKASLGPGYTILISENGTILYHPRVEMMEGNQTMRMVGSQTNSPTLIELSDSLEKKSAKGDIAYRSIYTRECTRIKYQRIPDLGWTLLNIAPDRSGQPWCIYHKQISLLLLAILALALWLWCLLSWRHVWWRSVGVTLLFLAGLVTICTLAVEKYESGICAPLSVLVGNAKQKDHDCSRTPLTNSFAASAYMNRCFEVARAMRSIPTGVEIQTINFTSAYSFSMSGYLWQRYRARSDTSLLGVEFPEHESQTMTLAYDDSLAPGQFLRGWRFAVNIRQPFNYRRYPVDKEEFWLRMAPKGLSPDILLEPDFMGYRQDGTSLFGIDQNLVLPHWKLLNTNFSYAVNQSSSNYGKPPLQGAPTPELYFSLHVRRNILDAFISHFIPLMVIVLMLFAILWVGRKQSSESKLLGFSSLSGASGCSGLFFIAIYNHISVRTALGVSEVVYMECFFFVTYAAILFVSLNAILVGMDDKSRFINHNDNQISRLLYWPLITGTLFVCTFVTFW